MKEEHVPNRTYYLALLAIVAVALALRLAGFGRVPPGLYHDEAYNGLDALRVLQGWRPLWFPANNGREPLFMYLMAVSIGLLGRTATAVRAPGLVLGLLTVPATAFMATSFFNRRVGLLAAAVTAITFWAVHLSHVGFRAVALPLFTALALGFLWRGLRSGRRRDYALGGLCYGLSIYTYLAARFTPVPLGLLALGLLWPAARLPKPEWRKLALFAAVALLVAAPLLATMAAHPEILGGRAGEVSVFNPAISHGDPWGTLLRQAGRGLAAFFIRGDRIARHNLPWRPIFDPALGLAFIVGLAVALRRRGAGWFVLAWTAVMLLPTILAEDTPHFLRAVGIQPLVFVLPALGLDGAWQWLQKRQRPALGVALATLVLLVGLGCTARDYLVRYPQVQAAYWFFEGGSRDLSDRINAFLQGSAEPRVYISQHLWQEWPSLRFLVPEGGPVQVIDPAAPPAPAPGGEVMLAVWPYEAYQPALALLPANSLISVQDDLQEQGDLDPQPRGLALIFRAGPLPQHTQRIADFDQGIRLLSAGVKLVTPRRLQVTLRWETGAPQTINYTAFVHVERPGAMNGQHDSPPADGLLPTTLWRVGDVIEDVHTVDLAQPYDPKIDQITVGLYDLATMARLHITGSGLPVANDAITLPAP